MAQRARDFTPSLRFPTQLVSQQAASIERGIAGLFGGAVRGAEQGMARKESRRRDDADRARQEERDTELDRHRGVMETQGQNRIDLEEKRIKVREDDLKATRLLKLEESKGNMARAKHQLEVLNSMGDSPGVRNEIARVESEIDRMSRGVPGLLDKIQQDAMRDADKPFFNHPEEQTAAALKGRLAESKVELALANSMKNSKDMTVARAAGDKVKELGRVVGDLTKKIAEAEAFETKHGEDVTAAKEAAKDATEKRKEVQQMKADVATVTASLEAADLGDFGAIATTALRTGNANLAEMTGRIEGARLAAERLRELKAPEEGIATAQGLIISGRMKEGAAINEFTPGAKVETPKEKVAEEAAIEAFRIKAGLKPDPAQVKSATDHKEVTSKLWVSGRVTGGLSIGERPTKPARRLTLAEAEKSLAGSSESEVGSAIAFPNTSVEDTARLLAAKFHLTKFPSSTPDEVRHSVLAHWMASNVPKSLRTKELAEKLMKAMAMEIKDEVEDSSGSSAGVR